MTQAHKQTQTRSKTGLNKGADGLSRCWWCGDDLLYMAYHDQEWGRVQKDDVRLFEKISLEGFQAGLSWITILRKRENFRAAFDHFNFYKIAKYDETDIERLLDNAGIIRHRGKIEAVINNAQKVIELIEEYGDIHTFLQQYIPRNKRHKYLLEYEELKTITTSAESVKLSKDLKKRGFKFVGPTTMYAFMQSIGMVNDHVAGCCVAKACQDQGIS